MHRHSIPSSLDAFANVKTVYTIITVSVLTFPTKSLLEDQNIVPSAITGVLGYDSITAIGKQKDSHHMLLYKLLMWHNVAKLK